MELRERLDAVGSLVHTLKANWVKENPDSPDLGIYLHFFRGDEIVAAVQCALDRDAALQAGGIGSMGFNATTMSISFESYHSTLQMSPLTGKRWKPQEMQYVSETHPEAIEKDWVFPCITTTIHERGGGYILHSEPYTIRGGELTWFEEKNVVVSSDDDGGSGAGLMFDYLQQSMARPTMDEQIRASTEENAQMARFVGDMLNDDETRLFHSDMATLRSLEERGLVTAVVFSAGEGTVRKDLLQNRFGAPDPE